MADQTSKKMTFQSYRGLRITFKHWITFIGNGGNSFLKTNDYAKEVSEVEHQNLSQIQVKLVWVPPSSLEAEGNLLIQVQNSPLYLHFVAKIWKKCFSCRHQNYVDYFGISGEIIAGLEKLQSLKSLDWHHIKFSSSIDSCQNTSDSVVH